MFHAKNLKRCGFGRTFTTDATVQSTDFLNKFLQNLQIVKQQDTYFRVNDCLNDITF